MTQMRRTRHFSTSASKGPVEFTIDDTDTPFRAVPAIPANKTGEFMAVSAAIGEAARPLQNADTPPTPDEVEKAVNEIVRLALNGLGMILLPESYERLERRLTSDLENPLDMQAIIEVFQWLGKVYNGTDDDENDSDPSPEGANVSPGSSQGTGNSSPVATSDAEPTSDAGASPTATTQTVETATPSDAADQTATQ